MDHYSLLREKFIISETTDISSLFVANGNRMKIGIPGILDPIVIRAHSMHMTLRAAAKIVEICAWTKTIDNIDTAFDWEKIWSDLIEGFELRHTPHTWFAVYYLGKPIYSYNEHHIFFDILESCEHRNAQRSEKYEESIIMTRKAFEKMGRSVMIEQESHMGFFSEAMDNALRFAITLRLPDHKSTFTTRLEKSKDAKVDPSFIDSMRMASDFIEGVNLAVQSGFIRKRIKKSRSQNNEDKKRLKEFQARIGTLEFAIRQKEAKYITKYRPEKPDFEAIEEKCEEA